MSVGAALSQAYAKLRNQVAIAQLCAIFMHKNSEDSAFIALRWLAHMLL